MKRELDAIVKPNIKSNERDCPRCNAVLVQNEKEECYECLNCGYIDCGDE
jgi:ribosomal protein S27AE